MKTLLTTTILAATATVGNAAIITFDLTGGSGSTSIYSDTVDGVTMTATPTGGDIALRSPGIGVSGTPEGPRLALGESIEFSFDVDFYEFFVTYAEIGSEDESVSVAVTGLEVVDAIAGDGSTGPLDYGFLFGPDPIDSFAVLGVEEDGPGNRGVFLASITIDTSAPVIPLPASAALMLGGLAVGAYWRRKSKA